MDINIIGEKKSKPGEATPDRRHTPQRDGQGDGDTIPARSAPPEDPSKK